MTLFAPLFGAMQSPARVTISELFEAHGSNPSGVNVTEASSLGMPAVWRAVNLIAGTTASLPLHAYRATDSGRSRVTSGRAANLLASPHPDLTPFELWETVLTHMLLWGNAYLWKRYDDSGVLTGLWPLHPSIVKPGRTSDGGTKVYAINDHHDAPMTDKEILHLPAFGYDGIGGMSPIRAAANGIGLALAAEEFGAKLFGNGTLASGILTTEQRLTPEQADSLSARWKAKRAGLNSAHDTIILDSGATFKQLTIPPEEAQFLQSRSFQVTEIARIFGIPPHMLMDTDKSTSWGTGIEQQSLGFVVYTLRPWLARIEQRVTKILKPEPVYARFSVEGLLRGDSSQRAAFYASMTQWGFYSVNEVRALEEMEPIADGDTHYRPLNMGPLGPTPPPQGAGA